MWAGTNENARLSNLSPRPFTYDGRSYHSVEHAYQTLKSGTFDGDVYGKYTAAGGRKIVGRSRANTRNNANIRLMEALMGASFEQNPDALAALLATGDARITHTQDRGVWAREFPRILMEIREEHRPVAQQEEGGQAQNLAETEAGVTEEAAPQQTTDRKKKATPRRAPARKKKTAPQPVVEQAETVVAEEAAPQQTADREESGAEPDWIQEFDTLRDADPEAYSEAESEFLDSLRDADPDLYEAVAEEAVRETREEAAQVEAEVEAETGSVEAVVEAAPESSPLRDRLAEAGAALKDAWRALVRLAQTLGRRAQRVRKRRLDEAVAAARAAMKSLRALAGQAGTDALQALRTLRQNMQQRIRRLQDAWRASEAESRASKMTPAKSNEKLSKKEKEVLARKARDRQRALEEEKRARQASDLLAARRSRNMKYGARLLFASQVTEGVVEAVRRAVSDLASDSLAIKVPAQDRLIAFGRTPVVLRAVLRDFDDINSGPFLDSEVMLGSGTSVIQKALGTHHRSTHIDKVSASVLERLPDLLADPLAVFTDSENSVGNVPSFKVLIDAVSETDGHPVVVAIHPNQEVVPGTRAHFIASIYPVEAKYIRRWINRGELRYYNDFAEKGVGATGLNIASIDNKVSAAAVPGIIPDETANHPWAPPARQPSRSRSGQQSAPGLGQRQARAAPEALGQRPAATSEGTQTEETIEENLPPVKIDPRVLTKSELAARPQEQWSQMRGDQVKKITHAEANKIRDYIKRVLGPKIKVSLNVDMQEAGLWSVGTAENLIQIGIHADDKLGTAYHEAMHEFFWRLGRDGREGTRAVLLRAAASAPVKRQLEKLLASFPGALEQMRTDPEERLAYMYQFWESGQLRIGPDTSTLFGKVQAFINKVAGLLTASGQAERIFQMFSQGEFRDTTKPGAVRGQPASLLRASLQEVWEGAERFTPEKLYGNMKAAQSDASRVLGELMESSSQVISQALALRSKPDKAALEALCRDLGRAWGSVKALVRAAAQYTTSEAQTAAQEMKALADKLGDKTLAAYRKVEGQVQARLTCRRPARRYAPVSVRRQYEARAARRVAGHRRGAGSGEVSALHIFCTRLSEIP